MKSLIAHIVALVLAVMALSLAGCGANAGPGDDAKSTPVLVKEAAQDVADAKADVSRAKVAVQAMTPANMEAQKPVAIERLDSADRNLQAATGKIDSAGAQAERDRKERERLAEALKNARENDPQIKILRWLSIGLICFAVAAAIASIWLPIKGLRMAAALGFVAGIGLGAIARWLHTLELFFMLAFAAILIPLLIYAGWTLWQWWKTQHIAENIVKGIEAGKAAGAVTFAPGGKDIIDEIQGDAARAFVDKVQEATK